MEALRRFAGRSAPCAGCGAPLPERHRHLLSQGRVACFCASCALRPPPGWNAPPEPQRVELGLSLEEWDRLGFPVRLVAFLRGREGGFRAVFPGPAGATEGCLEDPGFLPPLRADLEALVVLRGPDRLQAARLPLDAYYLLLGLLRRHFSWALVESFLECRGE
ncbi:MAG: DUF5947 family protein [Candidatus Eremiobacterota bacterium]